jgi:hypothetical protein
MKQTSHKQDPAHVSRLNEVRARVEQSLKLIRGSKDCIRASQARVRAVRSKK